MQWPGVGREQAQAEGQLSEVAQPLSGAFPRETTTRCASVCSRTSRRELRGIL